MHIASNDVSEKICRSTLFTTDSKYIPLRAMWFTCIISDAHFLNSCRFSSFSSLSHDCPFSFHIDFSSSRILMVKGDTIPRGSNTAETWDNTALCVIFTGIYFCLPLQTSRLSASTFHHCSPKIDGEVGSASKVLLEDGDFSAWSIDVIVCSQLLIHFVK